MFSVRFVDLGIRRLQALAPGTTVVGRAPDCDLLIDDASVSRRHAAFDVSGDRCVIRDLGSRNGVLHNGSFVTTAAVSDGDDLRVGRLDRIHDARGRYVPA